MTEAWDRLRVEMARREVRAIVAFSPENVAYTIGYMVPSHPTNRHRRSISILTADEKSVLIVVSVEAELARQQSGIKDVRSYDQFTQNPMDLLAKVLREFGVELADDVEVHVWDSTAELRYLVLPERPPGTEGMSEEALAALVTRDAMIGVAKVAAPAREGAAR